METPGMVRRNWRALGGSIACPAQHECDGPVSRYGATRADKRFRRPRDGDTVRSGRCTLDRLRSICQIHEPPEARWYLVSADLVHPSIQYAQRARVPWSLYLHLEPKRHECAGVRLRAGRGASEAISKNIRSDEDANPSGQ